MKSTEIITKILRYHRHRKGGFYEKHRFMEDYVGCTPKCDIMLKELEYQKLKETVKG